MVAVSVVHYFQNKLVLIFQVLQNHLNLPGLLDIQYEIRFCPRFYLPCRLWPATINGTKGIGVTLEIKGNRTKAEERSKPHAAGAWIFQLSHIDDLFPGILYPGHHFDFKPHLAKVAVDIHPIAAEISAHFVPEVTINGEGLQGLSTLKPRIN